MCELHDGMERDDSSQLLRPLCGKALQKVIVALHGLHHWFLVAPWTHPLQNPSSAARVFQSLFPSLVGLRAGPRAGRSLR